MESACDICGCTQTNLVDGYYYCVECGTQDTNVRETVVEVVTLGDGVYTFGARKKIMKIPQIAKEQMTDDWYRWHCLNFLLSGLASELVDLGAAPSFKTKLLWVWTRYMMKYQNKADFGLAPNEEDENSGDQQNIDEENIEANENLMNDEDYFSCDEGYEQIIRNYRKAEKPNIKRVNIPLVLSLLYVGLNLDKSHIQLTNLIRFIKEGRLSVLHWQKFVPKEMYPKKLVFCLLNNTNYFIYSYSTILQLAFQLFKELDLGTPIVPDLRMLLDQYMQELCLPNDLKPLVLSLMHARSYDYLDINVKFYETGRIPSYELYVISHILCAIKICFGVDGAYETKLSNAVDKINKMEDHPKSYCSEQTERLFSFREWCNYIQFRKCMLWRHTLYLGAPNYCDMNDYVAFEHQSDKPDFKKTLKDEIARDIINKLPDVEVNVIPKSEFPVTVTPHTTYTRVIIEHQQDPTVKQLLSEDFTKYSLKYIMEDMFLVDPESSNPKNVITGVTGEHLREFHSFFHMRVGKFLKTKFGKKMVYVKDCDNHNWVLTQRPKLEHIRAARNEKNGEIDEVDNDSDKAGSEENSVITDEVMKDLSSVTEINGDEKKPHESDLKETSVITEDTKVLDDVKCISELEIDEKNQNDDDLKIPEEAEHLNIFDDDFEDLVAKKEEDKDPEYNETDAPMSEIPADNNAYEMLDVFQNDPSNPEYRTGRDSDESSEDSIHLTPESLDRCKAIKELIIHACNKYKISIPGKYMHRTKKYNTVKKRCPVSTLPKVEGRTEKINGMVAEYRGKIQQDIFIQMANVVQSAITEFNETKEEMSMEVDEPPIEENDSVAGLEPNEIQTLNDISQDPHANETVDDGKYVLFDEDSDGETHAEELLPKKNVEFDETTHDVSQLYIKPANDISAPEITLNPNLYKIIDEKIEEEKEDINSPPEVKESSDSEEEMPLSMIKELKLLREQLTKQTGNTKIRLKPLINNPIPPYNFWIKHYSKIPHDQPMNQHFATEVDKNFPASFKILINECADVVGYPPFFLYRSLQRVETCIKDGYVRNKRIGQRYYGKQMKRCCRSRDILSGRY